MGCCQSVDSDSEQEWGYQRPITTPVVTHDRNRISARHDAITPVSTGGDWNRTPARQYPTFLHFPTNTYGNYVQADPVSNAPRRRSPLPYGSSTYSDNNRTDIPSPARNVVPVERSTENIIRRSPRPYDLENNRTVPVERSAATIIERSPRPYEWSPYVENSRTDARAPVGKSVPVEHSTAAEKPIIKRPAWDIHELLAEAKKIDTKSAKNIVQLFENQNTIPFICRYRKDLISRKITPDKLRDIKNAYTEIVSLRKRSESVISELENEGVINDEIRDQILCVKTVKELEFLQSIYKRSKKSARELGLEGHANHLLFGRSPPLQLQRLIEHTILELNTIANVKDVISEAISQQISTNIRVLNELRRLQIVHKFVLKCTKTELENDTTDQDQAVYEKYFKFENDVRHVKPHQILAINRGEKLGFLSVEIIEPDNFQTFVRSYVNETYMREGIKYELRNELFEMAFKECYTAKLFPLVCRQVRVNLTDAAEKQAVEVFARNLKELLLMPPLKGEPILGIDPGFRHGCKLALISATADLLGVTVLNPHSKRKDPERDGILLANMLARHGCKVIALGNGTACRETETWLRGLFDKGVLDGESINYAIVSEQGASVYSCTKEAKQEFPFLDVNLISAVSIARRLNDPLSEYTKIEPRHLGIGMYQHDINENFLSKSLTEVVSECVSFVGVDVNTASLSLLKHIAGLNEDRAKNIIQYRQKFGPFRTRNDLLLVPSVEEKEFVQCAGFIRIEPKSVGGKVDNVLDCTWVHPESYAVATKIITQCKLDIEDIGKPHFISKIQTFERSYSTDILVKHYGLPSERVKAVLAALQRELFQDYRKSFDKKLFKKEITQIEDLFIGEIVTGEVRNVVHFGAFVDIGLKSNALIHNKNMNNKKLKIGNRVSATVLELDVSKRHIDLRLDELI